MIVRNRGTRLALLLVAILLLTNANAAFSATAGGPAIPGAGGLDGPSGLQPSSSASVLDMIGRLTGLETLTSQGPPVASHVLGIVSEPTLLPRHYAAFAAAQPQPLRHALITWNDALALQDEDTLRDDPELLRADLLSRQVQEAMASLLYALTDATMLQAEALSALSTEERVLLASAPDTLLALGGDPEAWLQDSHLALVSETGGKVDMTRIRGAAGLVAATVADVLPALESWGAAERDASKGTESLRHDMDALLRSHDQSGVNALHRVERIGILEDVLAMAAAWMDGGVGRSALAPLAPSANLADSLGVLAGTLSALGLPLGDEAALADVMLLPAGLQAAIARIVVNYDTWLRSMLDLESAPAATAASTLRLVAAVRQSAPTLEAFGLLYSHNGYPSIPKSPLDLPRAPAGLAHMANVVGAAPRLAWIAQSGFLMQGVEPSWPVTPPVPPPGSLEDAVLELYSRFDLVVTEADGRRLHDDVAALAPAVERNAARLLWAQLEAVDRLTDAYASLTPEDLALLDQAVPAFVHHRILAGDVTVAELQLLERYYAIVDRVVGAYYDATIIVAVAADAVQQALGDYTQERMQKDLSKPPSWGRPIVALLDVLLPSASAQGTGGPCPPELPQCGQDILFSDPLLGAVVIGGFGSTTYRGDMSSLQVDDMEIGMPVRGQIVSLDLGGDDVYENNAGGSMLTLRASNDATGFMVDPTATALAIDLGGDDIYRPPKAASGADAVLASSNLAPVMDVIQGASAGGIGILWDTEGDDSYTANRYAQGFGGGITTERKDGIRCPPPLGAPAPLACLTGMFGVGLLLDGAGEDTYFAVDVAQGATAPAGTPTAAGTGLAGTGIGAGVGILVDGSGDDTYSVAAGARGQGHGDGGIGLLVDAAGDDTYRGGSQGQGVNGGLGGLADLAGSDSYTRRETHTQVRFHDGTCRASVHPGDALAGQSPGFGLFADVQNGDCSANVFHTLADLPSLDPAGLPDQILEAAGQLQETLVSLLGGLLSMDDDDGDGWANGLEAAAGTDPSDRADRPGGVPSKPANWPSTAPYPTDLGLPQAQPYVLRISGFIVVGDATNTFYPSGAGFRPPVADETIRLPSHDYLVSIDLGGDDRYENGVGGPLVPDAPTGEATSLPTLALDLAQGSDVYAQDGRSCVQGCGGILLDLGGNDEYRANDHAQGAAVSHPGRVGIHFDAGGNDTRSTKSGQGYAKQAIGLAMLVDVAGSDRYLSETQGVVASGGDADAAIALFLDLQGDDEYRPVGAQGQAGVKTGAPSAAQSVAVFADAGGDDLYIGRPGQPDGPDMSAQRNDRLDMKSTVFTAGQPPASTNIVTYRPRAPTSHGIFWDGGGATVLATEPAPFLDMPALGILVSAACSTGCDSLWTRDYALLVDPAGHDTYQNNAGSTLMRATMDPGASPGLGGSAQLRPAATGPLSVAAVLIDLVGDDVYDGSDLRHVAAPHIDGGQPTTLLVRPSYSGAMVQGSGMLGVGMLVDRGAGDDLFEARGLAQGFGLLGVGVLYSEGGDDVYAARVDQVRKPVVGASSTDLPTGFIAWEELQPWAADEPGLTWRPMVRTSDTCRIQLLEESTPGPTRDIAVHAASGRVLVSRLAEDKELPHWQLRHVAVDAGQPCSGQVGTSVSVAKSGKDSNQFHGAFGPDGLMVWQDDRDGTWSLFGNTLLGDADLCLVGVSDSCFAPRSSNQTRPVIDGSSVAFEDDRDARNGIYLLDLSTRTEANYSVDATGTHIPGINSHPSLSAALVAWHNHDTVQSIIVRHRLSETNETRVLDAATLGVVPGAFGPPSVSGGRVVFSHTPVDGRPTILSYNWGTDEVTILAVGALQPALHAGNPDIAAWIDESSEDGWEVKWSKNGLASKVSDTKSKQHGHLLQGTAWQAGVGALLDQGGQDSFTARMFAQGAAFSAGPRDGNTRAAGDGESYSNLDHGAFGVVVNAAGNDRYVASRFSQGVHVGGTFEQSHGINCCPAQIASLDRGIAHAELTANAGVLLDLRGADQYAASANSQGYGALMFGKNLQDRPGNHDPLLADGSLNNPGPNDRLARDVYALASVANLLDLGGKDHYDYRPVSAAPLEVCSALGAAVEAAWAADPTGASLWASIFASGNPILGAWNATGRAAWDTLNATIHDGNPTLRDAWLAVRQTFIDFDDMIKYWGLSERHPGNARNPALAPPQTTPYTYPIETDADTVYVFGRFLPPNGGSTIHAVLVNTVAQRWADNAREHYQSTVDALDELTSSGAPDDLQELWPEVQDLWFELDAIIAGATTGTGPIPLPIPDDLSGGPPGVLRAACQEHVEPTIAEGQKSADELDLTLVVPDDGHNNRVWTQTSRNDADIHPASNTGGVGVDVPAMDQVANGLKELAEEMLDVQIQALHDGQIVSERASGTLALDTVITYRESNEPVSSAVSIQFVEVFIDGLFRGLAQKIDTTPTSETWRIDWQTDSPDIADGTHSIESLAHYGLSSAPQLGTFGSVSAVQNVSIDNPPHFLHFGVAVPSSGFSPGPAADDAASPPAILFNLTADHPGSPDATHAQIRVLDAQTQALVTTLRSFEDGPIAAQDVSARATWDGTHAGAIMPSGRYIVVVDVSDSPMDSDRTRTATAPVTVDSLPPAGGCIRLGAGLGASPCKTGEVPVGLKEAGPGSEHSLVGDVQLTFSLDGDDVRRVYVFQAEPADWDAWTLVDTLDVPPGLSREPWATTLEHGDQRRILVLFEDLVGNVECVPECGAGHPDLIDVPNGTILDAALRKAATDAFVEFVTDFIPPVVTPFEVDGQVAPYLIDNQTRRGVPPPRVGPERDVVIQVGVDTEEVTSEIRWTAFDGVANSDAITWADDDLSFTCSIEPFPCGLDDPFVWRWANWTNLPAAATWPDGQLDWAIHVHDAAGNAGETQRGWVLYDATPPELLAPPVVRYPDGKATAGENEIITVTARIADAPAGAFPADWRRFQVVLNVSNVSTAGDAGLLTLTPHTQPGRFHGSFAVDSADLPELSQEALLVHLPLAFADEAGNWNTTDVKVLLGEPQLGLEKVNETVTTDEVSVSWTTVVPSNVTLLVTHPNGTIEATPNQLSLVHEHNFTLDVLPASLYTYVIEAEDALGFRQIAGPVVVRTLAGLQGDLTAPQDDTPVAGIVPVQGSALVSSDPLAKPRVEMRIVNTERPGEDIIIMDEIISGPGSIKAFGKSWVTSALADGVYAVEALITYQSPVLEEKVTLQVKNLTVDNSPPQIFPVSPVPGEQVMEVPNALRIAAIDEWTDLDPTSIQVTINGIPRTFALVGVAAGPIDHDIFDILLEPGDELLPGPIRVTATIRDVAGNIGSTSFTIHYDPDGPGPRVPDGMPVHVDYPLGQQAAAPGQIVRIRAILADAGEIADVVLNGTALGADRLLMQDNGLWHEAVLRVGDVPGGIATVEVTARDVLGNVAHYSVDVHVELAAPTVVATDSIPLSLTSARYALAIKPAAAEVEVRLFDDELLVRTIASPGTLEGFPDLAAHGGVFGYAVDLADLEPGAVYKLVISVKGAAGHLSTHEETWRFVPVVIDPPTVDQLTALVDRDSTVRLEWALHGIVQERHASYLVYRSDGETFAHIATVWTGQYRDDPPPGATYSYYVQSQNLAGLLGEVSEVAVVQIPKNPAVTVWGVSPQTGVQGTPFVFTAKVEAAATSAPLAWVVLEGKPYRMHLVAGDCRDVCEFSVRIEVPAAFRVLQQNYRIEVMDAGTIMYGPATGEAPGPRVLVGYDAEAVHDNGHDIPAPASGVAMLAVAIAVLSRRRWWK